MTNDPYYSRSVVVSWMVIVIVAIFACRLFYLQVIDQSTADKADNNALLRQTIYPSRGLIYDRNDSLLVYNQPVYDLMLVMREMTNGFDTLAFCEKMCLTREAFDKRISEIKNRKKNHGYSKYTPQVFMSLLTKEDISKLQESLYLFSGVSFRKRTIRDYCYESATHVIGSVGEVNQRDIDRDSYYAAGDYSGRDGIERQYERLLRGVKGVEVLMRDSRGRIQGSYHNGERDEVAVAGMDLHLTLDVRLQQMAEELLRGKVGSVVAIEPATGEILAMVSSPAWNPKDLVGRKRSKNYSLLLHDKYKPLMNRAVQATYPPGSTFKLVQSLIGLQMGAISPTTVYPCSGPESTPIRCTHDHGSPVSLGNAIEQSCNPYFWQEFRDLLQMNGYGKGNKDFRKTYDTWRNHVLSFGLGSKFPTDISEQSSGSIPTTKLFDRIYGKTGWKAITIRSLSIGQGEILVTPLQLANLSASIANEGYYVTPHLVRQTEAIREAYPELDIVKKYTMVDSRHFPIVKDGMERVMMYGTGRWYNIPEWTVCGKTGTVQNPHGNDHSIFIGFAPKSEPKIAVAVVVENAGFGATWACPVGTLMMEKYLTDSISNQTLYDRLTGTRWIDE